MKTVHQSASTAALVDYFRCPEELVQVDVRGPLAPRAGFFRYGRSNCYGQSVSGEVSKNTDREIPRADCGELEGEVLALPFDLSQVLDNFRLERYVSDSKQGLQKLVDGSIPHSFYYLVRPVLPVAVRKYLQRARLHGWQSIGFPRWPVDFSVEMLMQDVLGAILRTRRLGTIPFIWFWPDGLPSCSIMTHDVEAVEGRDSCGRLMDLDDSFGIKSAFQVVPEVRYGVDRALLETFRQRGFELNVHDLNHDGHLFRDKKEFLRRAVEINRYAKHFQSEGFRAGAMYRNTEWYDAFDFSYDMSVPNVAHLEPQRGGCCTVMPYFIGRLLELPLTTIQDYSLFHILGDYSTELWKQQIESISAHHGLISFISHPDYLIEKRAWDTYSELIAHLALLRSEQKLWIALPRDVDRWWRSRNRMKLITHQGKWKIEGPDSDRARVAFATLEDDVVRYTFEA